MIYCGKLFFCLYELVCRCQTVKASSKAKRVHFHLPQKQKECTYTCFVLKKGFNSVDFHTMCLYKSSTSLYTLSSFSGCYLFKRFAKVVSMAQSKREICNPSKNRWIADLVKYLNIFLGLQYQVCTMLRIEYISIHLSIVDITVI